MVKYTSYHDRVAKAQQLVRELITEKFSKDEIIKAVYEQTQLGKRWVEQYLDILDAAK